MSNPSIIVIGEMNTDIAVNGLPHFPQAGELVNGQKLQFGPGGKSRNIAAMTAVLSPAGSVAMVSKTVQDKYGLWREPVTSLEQAGVDTHFVKVLPEGATGELPGIAIILVDSNGQNQIIGAPGISRQFSTEDIDEADELFTIVGQNGGYLVFIGNCPLATAQHAIKKAQKLGIKVIFDPGGADDITSRVPLLKAGIHIFKPNEHEAKALSGIEITDMASAKAAAQKFRDLGVEIVLMTAGANGAYLLSENNQKHIPIPDIAETGFKDETGCGDQTLAALCAALQMGKSLEEAAEIAILAGTLQFHRAGIVPVLPGELSI